MFRNTFVIVSIKFSSERNEEDHNFEGIEELTKEKIIWWTAGRESGHKEIDACGNPGGKF